MKYKLKDYKPVFGTVIGNKLHGGPTTVNVNLGNGFDVYPYSGKVVDLNTVDFSNYNLTSKRWKFKTKPTVETFLSQLISKTHPLIEFESEEFVEDLVMPAEVETDLEISEVITTTKALVKLDNMFPASKGVSANLNRFNVCTATTNSPVQKITNITLYDCPMTSYLRDAFNQGCTLSTNTNLYYYFNPKELSKKVETTYYLASLNPPQVTDEQRTALLKEASKNYKQEDYWIISSPNEVEFEDNSAMLEQVREHCKGIPGFEVVYLRKHIAAYVSDGSMECTLDAVNYHTPKLSIHTEYDNQNILRVLYDKNGSGSPLIYFGECYQIYFTIGGKDVLEGCRILFATPEQYYAAYSKLRPDIVDNFVPWSDLLFIGSSWCQRNRLKSLDKGYNLQTPKSSPRSLYAWIVDSAFSRIYGNGHSDTIPGYNVIYGAKLKGRVERLNKFLTAANKLQ